MVHEQPDEDNRADALERRAFMEHLRQQTRMTESIVETMFSLRTSLVDQRDSIRSNNRRLSDIEARVQALEDAQKPPPAQMPQEEDPFVGLQMTENGRFLCPRCGNNYVRGYILKHIANKKNKNCVPQK